MPQVEVSHGELVDKWTILEIKSVQLVDANQLKNVQREMDAMKPTIQQFIASVLSLHKDLLETNLKIWNLMDELYKKDESSGIEYVKITIEITKFNQKRSFIKKEIDKFCNSNFSEAKSYFENEDQVVK
jgi:hypothetical protein